MTTLRKGIGRVLVRLPKPVRSLTGQFPRLVRPLRRLSWRLLPPGAQLWVRVRSHVGAAFWLLLDPRYQSDYWFGRYEPQVQKWLWEVLGPGKIFCDVGAHVGFFVAIAAEAVGPLGAVIAFEPDPENAAKLRAQLDRNATPWVQVIEKAAWSKTGRLAFVPASDLSGRSTGAIDTCESGLNNGATEILAVPLSVYFRDHSPPDVIKIDVEGAEAEVLMGMTEILSKKRPILLIEIHDPENASHCASILRSSGYRWGQFEEVTQAFPVHWAANHYGFACD